MFQNTIVHCDTRVNPVQNMISTYRKNFKRFSSEIERRVDNNAELKHYFSAISSEHIKISVLDTVSSDKVLQKKYAQELMKFFTFYNDTLLEEAAFLQSNSSLENAINILHNSNDKLLSKLQEIHQQFENNYNKEPQSEVEFKNVVISLPKETYHEVDKINRFNLSNRNSF